MSEKIENPPAFPSLERNQDGTPYHFNPGMSLRDYFAGQALAGMCANSGGPIQSNGMTGWGLVNCDEGFVASRAYRIADAMLAERAKAEGA